MRGLSSINNEEVVAWEESEDGDYYYNENEIEI